MNDDRDDLYQLARTDMVNRSYLIHASQPTTLRADWIDWEIEMAWWVEGQS